MTMFTDNDLLQKLYAKVAELETRLARLEPKKQVVIIDAKPIDSLNRDGAGRVIPEPGLPEWRDRQVAKIADMRAEEKAEKEAMRAKLSPGNSTGFIDAFGLERTHDGKRYIPEQAHERLEDVEWAARQQ